MAGESALLELRRLYHCAAYNCAIALISCSFNETKFYQGFLFTEKSEKVCRCDGMRATQCLTLGQLMGTYRS